MKKLFIVAFISLTALISCMPVIPTTTESNQPPVAYIDSVSPTSSVITTKISFAGHGADPDGTVVGYEWRSDLDGILSPQPSFDTTNLSVGKHAIYFRVQDNKDLWSREEFTYVQILPGYTTKPVINSFVVKPEKISRGQSAVLSWDLSNTSHVTITPDIGDVQPSGTRIVYPSADTTYQIIATNDVGRVVGAIKIVILADQTRTVDLYAIPAESGGVRADQIVSSNPVAGMMGAGFVWQAFFSFDISVIPAGAKLKSASLDLSNHFLVGSPFNYLGGMGVIQHDYYTVDGTDYVTPFPTTTLYVGYTEPLQPYVATTITDAVQQKVDKQGDRFQIRIQFEKYYYHEQSPNDYLLFYPDKAKLTVTYEEP